MPELPEVHTTVKMLEGQIVGLTIKDVWSDYDSKHYKGKDNIKDTAYFKRFRKEVSGEVIVAVERKGKNVLIRLSEGKTVLTHMKMTGHFLYGKYRKTTPKERGFFWGEWIPEKSGPLRDDPFNRFVHLVFSLSDGNHLVLSDARKFATVFVYKNESPPETVKCLGPDPLEKSFTFESFLARLPYSSRRPIKQVLLDQSVISGIGNIYSDEILWHSSLHPKSTVGLLPRKTLYNVYRSMKTILREGIDFQGDSVSDYRLPNGERGSYHFHHKVYQKKGQPCSYRGCKGKIEKLIIGGRSSHFCDQHQTLFSKI